MAGRRQVTPFRPGSSYGISTFTRFQKRAAIRRAKRDERRFSARAGVWTPVRGRRGPFSERDRGVAPDRGTPERAAFSPSEPRGRSLSLSDAGARGLTLRWDPRFIIRAQQLTASMALRDGLITPFNVFISLSTRQGKSCRGEGRGGGAGVGGGAALSSFLSGFNLRAGRRFEVGRAHPEGADQRRLAKPSEEIQPGKLQGQIDQSPSQLEKINCEPLLFGGKTFGKGSPFKTEKLAKEARSISEITSEQGCLIGGKSDEDVERQRAARGRGVGRPVRHRDARLNVRTERRVDGVTVGRARDPCAGGQSRGSGGAARGSAGDGSPPSQTHPPHPLT
ncbi:hypothetical protein SKAU_G00335380 [Synaphobranchus kaupii]|uniref:Uncharacterized protein n=1 Tax=Synaphobranchus kaupii TaxID=118154 RepID=A0A9Q1ELZ7_SYNKA|nr:hypothetical protein SKAU_G00335380 [Synaphobranchus kaupii]